LEVFFYWFYKFGFESFNSKLFDLTIRVVGYAFVFLILGFGFSSIKNVLFDLKNNKYKDEYAVGPIKFGRWKKLPKIKYVSLFKQPLKDGNYIFEVNLWYKRNKHFNIYKNNYFETALEMAFYIASKLNIKLLDATKANDYKYLDMGELKKKFKI